MLGSLNPSSSVEAYQNQGPSSSDLHRLLLTCAELVSQSNFSAARRLISILSSNSSPYGDATERLVHHFTSALSLRLTRNLNLNPNVNVSICHYNAIQSCYLSLNQITPFIRFCHLTSNQAILETVDGNQAIHILDFDIMHGVQWPPLMQAIAERSNPPMLRITATGNDLTVLHRTGERLSTFAQSLGLSFRFHSVLILNDDDVIQTELNLLPNETLAVNCVLYLHKLNARDLSVFLRRIKSLNPKVVTIAEREANHNHPLFLNRFVEAMDHYAPIFQSLEATLPPNSQERMAVEQVWFGREIMDIVAADDGEKRRERHERFETWERVLRRLGFGNLALSGFALSQAKLLLRLHYPSEGYQLQVINDCFFLAWQNRPLFSISSWH